MSEESRPYIRSRHIKYATNIEEFYKYKNKLKFVPCPHCRAAGQLICHGYLHGYGDKGHEKIRRGWRIFCSNRNLRKGCGRTFSILLAVWLYRRMIDANRLWNFLKGRLHGSSIKKAWEAISSPFCLETGYKIWASFIRNQSHIRSLLFRLALPTALNHIQNPAFQLIAHLKKTFRHASCPVASFQIAFQQAFLAR